MLRHRLLRKQPLNREGEFPVGAEFRLLDIVVTSQLEVDGLLAKAMHLTNAATHGHLPSVIAVGFPIGSKDRRGGEIPAVVDVVVDEEL